MWNLIGRTKRSLLHFTRSKPGDRFQVRYYRRKQSGHGRFSFRRIFNIVAGSVLVVFSTFFGWVPGPGLLTFFLGLAMIAGELLPVARFLDWAEVRLRKMARFVAKVWRGSLLGKVSVLTVAALCAAAIAYAIYRLFFAG